VDRVWPAMIDYLETGFLSSGPIAGAYDLAARLPLLRHETLLLGAERDSLAATFERARTLLPSAEAHFFAGHHPIHFPERAADYVEPVCAFLERRV